MNFILIHITQYKTNRRKELVIHKVHFHLKLMKIKIKAKFTMKH
jgi:hypothetical protein